MNEREVTFEVTEDHILDGCPEEGAGCPIALALIDEMDCWSVSVDCDSITLQDSISAGCCATTPDEIADFIQRFDAGKPVEPEVFTITFRTGL